MYDDGTFHPPLCLIHSPVVLIMYEWCSPVPDDKLTKEYIASYGGYTVDTYYSYGDSFSECNKKDSTAIHQCCFWETPSTMFLRERWCFWETPIALLSWC